MFDRYTKVPLEGSGIIALILPRHTFRFGYVSDPDPTSDADGIRTRMLHRDRVVALPKSHTAPEAYPVGFEPTCHGLTVRCFPI